MPVEMGRVFEHLCAKFRRSSAQSEQTQAANQRLQQINAELQASITSKLGY